VPDQTHILFGLAVDSKLGDSVAVTLISSLDLAQLNAHATAAPPAEMMAEAPVPVAAKRETRRPVAPPPPAEEDLLFETIEVQAELAPEPEVEVPAPVEPATEVIENKIESAPEMEAEEPFSEEFEDENTPIVASTPETARVPVRTPVTKELADAARENGNTLATVVARSVTLQTEAPPVAANDLLILEHPAPVTKIRATTLVTRTKVSEQPSLSLGDEDRGRFKDTEPSIIEGEDLDVPTWKRLKMKLKR
jgi:cell division protein FtsZ